MNRWWVKLLLAVAGIALLLGLMLSFSSVHARSAVDQYKDKLRAAGEKMDLADVIPPKVKPELNGASDFNQAFRLMGPTMEGILSTNPPSAMRIVVAGKAMVGWRQAEIFSGSSPMATNSWADLESELVPQHPVIESLAHAGEHPEVNFELDYQKGADLPLSHLSKVKRSALLLSAQVMADLHRGDLGVAVTNLHTQVRIVNAWKDEPFLISQLVRIALAQIAVNIQWELLQSTNISDEHLAMLQRDWTEMEIVPQTETTFAMERIWMEREIERLRHMANPSSAYSGLTGGGTGGGGSGDWLDGLRELRDTTKRKTADALWRVSWSYDDELKMFQGDQVLIDAARQIRTNGYFKDAIAERDRKFAVLGLNRSTTNWLRIHLDDEMAAIAESSESVSRVLDRVEFCEAARTMTYTAIALKRYELRHGKFPGTLSDLVPEFLAEIPRDPVDGKPLRYQFGVGGTFQLYSIGADAVDNGGDASVPPTTKTLNWLRGRDWVWPQPATALEIQNFSPP